MNPFEITISITLIANGLAATLSDEQLQLTAAIFTQLGDTLSTISIQRSLYNSSNSNPSDSSNDASSNDTSFKTSSTKEDTSKD